MYVLFAVTIKALYMDMKVIIEDTTARNVVYFGM